MYSPLKPHQTSKKLTNITLGIHLIKISFLPQKRIEVGKKSFSFIGLYVWQKITIRTRGFVII